MIAERPPRPGAPGCTCHCHVVPGVSHIVACCSGMPFQLDNADIRPVGVGYTPTWQEVRASYSQDWNSERVMERFEEFSRFMAGVQVTAIRDAIKYARPDGVEYPGMSGDQVRAFENALELVEEYAWNLERGRKP